MELARCEAAEWFAECEITDDIESGEVEPVYHVEGFILCRESFHMSDEFGDVVLDYVFLFYEGFLREGMGESSTLTGVVCVIGHGKRRHSNHGLNGADMDRVFVEVGVAWPVPVNIFPCLDGVEVKFCWGDTNNWAVLVVEKFVLEGDAPFEESADPGNWGDGVQFGSWEFCKRVES
jgi:hypothetical protein